MGSRLKGKKSRKSNEMDRRVVMKLIIYTLVGVAVIALLWGLWLSKTGLEKAQEMKSHNTTGRTTGN